MRCDERCASSQLGWVRCHRTAVAKVATPAGRTLHFCGTHARTWQQPTAEGGQG